MEAVLSGWRLSSQGERRMGTVSEEVRGFLTGARLLGNPLAQACHPAPVLVCFPGHQQGMHQGQQLLHLRVGSALGCGPR